MKNEMKIAVLNFDLLIGLALVVSGCAAESQPIQKSTNVQLLRAIQVPSDSRAQYYFLEKSGNSTFRTLTTKRVGPSGTSYAKRLFNCSQKTVKYLAEGENLSAVRAATSSSYQLAPIVSGSIAYYMYLEACN